MDHTDYSSESYQIEEDLLFGNNVVDKFLYHHLDYTIDLYEKIKQSLGPSSPFFLGNLSSVQFTHYIVDKFILKKNFNHNNRNLLNHFCKCYINELQISHSIINRFIRNVFRCPLLYNDWVNFCYSHSDLYELQF